MNNLRLFLASILLSAMAWPLQSHAQGLRLGIKAGVNFDKTQGEHLDGDFSGYFLGGAYVGLQFTKFRIQAEALYSQNTMTTGSSFKDAFNNYISQKGEDLKSGSFEMNELSVPIVVGVNIVPKLLWVEVGPQYTAAISLKDKDGFLTDVENVVKKGYVSGLVGASLELPLNLNVTVRYVFGLTDRNNTDVSEQWRSSHIQATVGYSFVK